MAEQQQLWALRHVDTGEFVPRLFRKPAHADSSRRVQFPIPEQWEIVPVRLVVDVPAAMGTRVWNSLMKAVQLRG